MKGRNLQSKLFGLKFCLIPEEQIMGLRHSIQTTKNNYMLHTHRFWVFGHCHKHSEATTYST